MINCRVNQVNKLYYIIIILFYLYFYLFIFYSFKIELNFLHHFSLLYRATGSRATLLAACHYSFYGFCCWLPALNAASISQTKQKKKQKQKQMRKAALLKLKAESRSWLNCCAAFWSFIFTKLVHYELVLIRLAVVLHSALLCFCSWQSPQHQQQQQRWRQRQRCRQQLQKHFN